MRKNHCQVSYIFVALNAEILWRIQSLKWKIIMVTYDIHKIVCNGPRGVPFLMEQLCFMRAEIEKWALWNHALGDFD